MEEITEIKLKTCSKCGMKKELNESNFNKHSTSDGFRADCKICQKKYMAERWIKVRETYLKKKTTCLSEQELNSILKICSKCKIKKPLKDFDKNCMAEHGRHSNCKLCRKEAARRPDQRKRISKYRKEYDKVYTKSEKWKKWYRSYMGEPKVKENISQAQKLERYKIKRRIASKIRRSSPKGKLDHNLSNNINRALKFCGGKAYRHWETLVGYTTEELKLHLEKQFKEGMSWDNYGQTQRGKKFWQIDHIIPRSSFNITSAECDDFKKCWALNNLQPLWWWENLAKSNKVTFSSPQL